DKRSGKFKIVKGTYTLDGGGRPNVSANVGVAGTSQALSIYHVPKSDLCFAAISSRAVEAGSTRGCVSLHTIMGFVIMYVEYGEGLTTSQAVMVRNILGRAPDRASFGVVDWPEMPLISTNNPNATPPDKESELAANPRWTPLFTAPMSASNGVYFVGHATRE